MKQHFRGMWEVLEEYGLGPSIFGFANEESTKELWEWSKRVRWDENQREGSALGAERFWMTITDEMWKGTDTREYPPDFSEPPTSDGRTLTVDDSAGRTLAEKNDCRTSIEESEDSALTEPSEGRTLTAPQQEQQAQKEELGLPRRAHKLEMWYKGRSEMLQPTNSW